MLVIIDGNHLLHRVLNVPDYFSMEYLGRFTGGVFGAINCLNTVYSGIPKDSRVVCVWDGKKSLRRMSLFPDYKANRIPKTDQDKLVKEEYMKKFNHQKKIICDRVLPNLGIINIESSYEADDIIYKIAEIYHSKDSILVVSEDNGLLQIITEFPNVRILRPIKKDSITRDNFKEVIGVPHELFLLYKAIIGHKSDNLKGATGEITAQKLINKVDINNQHESFIKITKEGYDADMKTKNQKLKRESKIYTCIGQIAKNLELIDLSREYIDNQTVHNIKTSIDSFIKTVNEPELNNVLVEYGFKSILNNYEFWIQTFK